MLALHGWGRNHRDLLDCVSGADAISADLPGFGSSPAPAVAGGAAAYADAVEPLLTECASRVVVMGHSFGGRVGVELAVRHPDAVAALVLCGVPLLRRSDQPTARPALRFRLARALHRRRLLGDGTMERMRQQFGSADYRNATGVMRDVLTAVVNETYEAQLSQISQPTELVWGRLDNTVPVEIAERAAQILADARLTVLDDVGHFVPTEAPDALGWALRRRLDELA